MRRDRSHFVYRSVIGPHSPYNDAHDSITAPPAFVCMLGDESTPDKLYA